MLAKRAALLTLLTAVMASGASPATPPPEAPPKVALVLSGGGARGAAHIGVLEVLDELRIVPDMVVGTSMGSIVGALYASGWAPEEIEELLRSVDWDRVFTDRVERSERSFRRKQDDRPVLIPSRLHFDGFKPYLPSGVLGGQSLESLLLVLELQSGSPTDFGAMPIPFRAVAADINTGEAVVLDSGSLATAMRASMSIPGAFAPVELDGRQLVDGGIVANLPIGIAHDLGADVVIAVDISSPLGPPDAKRGNFWSVYNQLNSLMTVANRTRDVERLRPGDVLIQPELGDISFIAFNRAAEAVELGEQAARTQVDALRRFAADELRWQSFAAERTVQADDRITIDSVRIVNSSPVSDAIVRRAITLQPPQQLDRETLRQDLLRLAAARYYGNISIHLEQQDEQRELVITTPAKPSGRGTLQFGLGLANDFDGDAAHSVTVRHQLLAANRHGGEWQSLLQGGTITVAATEFYQPLGAAMMWFVSPSAQFRTENRDLWFEGQPVAQYRRELLEGRADIGRVLGNWGELRLGGFAARDDWSPRVGLPVFPDAVERFAGARFGLRADTVNAVIFPRSGLTADVRYTAAWNDDRSSHDFQRVFAAISPAWSWGKYTVTPHLEYGTNLVDSSSVSRLFPLGGFGRLSGLGYDELLGEQLALARLQAYRRLFRLAIAGIRLRAFAGLSLEAGNVYDRQEAVTLDNLRTSWAAFVGAETPIGPIIAAYGRTDGGRDRFYLSMGDSF
jgi:NTE family protein